MRFRTLLQSTHQCMRSSRKGRLYTRHKPFAIHWMSEEQSGGIVSDFACVQQLFHLCRWPSITSQLLERTYIWYRYEAMRTARSLSVGLCSRMYAGWILATYFRMSSLLLLQWRNTGAECLCTRTVVWHCLATMQCWGSCYLCGTTKCRQTDMAGEEQISGTNQR